MSRKSILAGIAITVFMIFSGSAGILAKPGPREIDISGLDLSQIESLFPSLKAADAALVHATPKIPFQIEGITYQPDEVSLFDGQRLWYVFDNSGALLAFTSPQELEAFVEVEYATPQAIEQSAMTATLTSTLYARFYKDIDYSGGAIYVRPGMGVSSLGYFDNIISSARVDAGIDGAALFDLEYFQGDVFWIPGGVRYYWLMAFDDMASSIMVFQ